MENYEDRIRRAAELLASEFGAIIGLQQTVLRSKTDAMRSERT